MPKISFSSAEFREQTLFQLNSMPLDKLGWPEGKWVTMWSIEAGLLDVGVQDRH